MTGKNMAEIEDLIESRLLALARVGPSAWRNPMKTKTLYLLGPESLDRVGDCWARGRLRPGDIVLCDELAGDCFYDWYLVDFTKYSNQKGVDMRLIPYAFGAYAMAATELKGFSERDYHLLKAGERLEVMVELPDIQINKNRAVAK